MEEELFILISLNNAPKALIDNTSSLVHDMGSPGPLSGPMTEFNDICMQDQAAMR